MKTALTWLLAAYLSHSAVAQAQDKEPWIGRRVFTQYGTVLKIGNNVIDDEGRAASLKASGNESRVSRVYRVEHVNGEWLWLQDEESGISGWVQTKYVIPYEQAVDHYTNLIRANPQASLYNNRGLVWASKGEYDIGIADFNKAIRLDPKDAVAYNNRAWLWATCPVETHRDGKRAVDSATKACELSGWKDGGVLDTLAAAYAEAGEFDKAVEWQEKARKLWTDADVIKKSDERLALYKEKKPYRQEPGK
jgi:tetratricopeptide (TPR) repeat protein